VRLPGAPRVGDGADWAASAGGFIARRQMVGDGGRLLQEKQLGSKNRK
jgi:hypothetical protein